MCDEIKKKKKRSNRLKQYFKEVFQAELCILVKLFFLSPIPCHNADYLLVLFVYTYCFQIHITCHCFKLKDILKLSFEEIPHTNRIDVSVNRCFDAIMAARSQKEDPIQALIQIHIVI